MTGGIEHREGGMKRCKCGKSGELKVCSHIMDGNAGGFAIYTPAGDDRQVEMYCLECEAGFPLGTASGEVVDWLEGSCWDCVGGYIERPDCCKTAVGQT